jgi:enoyl-[acyl-carrier protein] reductase I
MIFHPILHLWSVCLISKTKGKETMIMQDKQGLICGVANKASIAHAIARSLHREGARLAFTYQGERIKQNVEEIAEGLDSNWVFPCDVTKEEEIRKLFDRIRATMHHLDFMVHSIAFALKDELKRDFHLSSRSGFQIAHDISAYSLIALAREAYPLMRRRGGSILALTYFGSEKVVPNYHVMGAAKASLEASVRYLAADLGPMDIRVNAISAGPVNTLAARGVPGFTKILDFIPERAPLRRNVEVGEIGNAGLFLCSPWASGITGEILHVDCGYNITGM